MKQKFFYGYAIVLIASIVIAVAWGTRNVFGVFFNPVMTEFGWTSAVTAGAFSLHMIMSGLMGTIVGGFADRRGPRLVTTLCCVLFGTGLILMSGISNAWHLYLLYGVVGGVGMSGTRVPLLATVARWFTKRRNSMTGVVLAGSGIGALAMPPIANWLISTFDWRTSYVILGSFLVVATVLPSQFLKRDPAQIGQMPFGESKSDMIKPGGKAKGFSLKEALRTRQFFMVCTIFFFFGFSLYSIMVHIVPYVIKQGLSNATGANILATIGGMGIFSRVALGTLADKIGNRRTFIAGFILLAAAFVALVLNRETWMFFVFAMVVGFAQGGMGTSESPLIASLFGVTAIGSIYGATAIGFTLGAAAGPLLSGYMVDLTGSYQPAFIVCAISSVFGMVTAVLITPVKKEYGVI